MAVFHGKAGTVTWDGGGTAHVTNWTLNVTCDLAEATAMGDTYKTHTVGFFDSSATVNSYIDSGGLDPDIANDLGRSSTLLLDTTTGLSYSLTAICNDIAMNVDSDGNPTVTYSFAGNGTIVTQA